MTLTLPPPRFLDLPVHLAAPSCRGPDLSCYLIGGRVVAWVMTERAAEELFGVAGLAALKEAERRAEEQAERWAISERARE